MGSGPEWAGQVERVRDEAGLLDGPGPPRRRPAAGRLANLVVAGERRLGKAAVLLANWRKAQEDSDG